MIKITSNGYRCQCFNSYFSDLEQLNHIWFNLELKLWYCDGPLECELLEEDLALIYLNFSIKKDFRLSYYIQNREHKSKPVDVYFFR